MSDGRVVLVPPAAPGSGGDEGMIRGAIELFRNRTVVIFNPTPERLWLDALGTYPDAESRVLETPGPLASSAEHLRLNDTVVVIGADVVDGTCGLEPSLERCDLILRALALGLKVYVSLSFRSQVAPAILERLRPLASATFMARDVRSLTSFRLQVGTNCRFFPDLAFFCQPASSEYVKATLAEISLCKSENPVIGVNFSEHSFRSFSDEHDDESRARFVDIVLSQISDAHPDASFVLFSNDRRNWPNHPSDEYYQDLAADWIRTRLEGSCTMRVDGAAGYTANLSLIGAVDLLVAGRMHLAIAAFRAGTIPIVLMGQGKGYTSVDKMRGAFDENVGDSQGVVSDIKRLGEVCALFFSEKSQIEARIRGLGQARDSNNKREVARLMAEMQKDDCSVGGKGDGQDPLILAISSLIRRSDELSAERATLDRLRERVAGHDQEIAKLRANNEKQEQVLSALHADLTARDDTITELRTERKASESAAMRLRAEVEEGCNSFAQLRAELETRESRIAGLQADYAASASAIADLRAELETRDSQIAGLRADRAASATAIADLRAELETRDSQIAGLHADRAASASAIAGLHAEMETRDSRIADLRAEFVERCDVIASQRDELACQRHELAERDRLDARIDGSSDVLIEVGDRLVQQLTRAYARPWRPLKLAIQRIAVSTYLIFDGFMPERMKARLRASRNKRSSRRFGLEWLGARDELALRKKDLLAFTKRVPPNAEAIPKDWPLSSAAMERRRNGRFNILYFSPFPSHPDNHGNQATIQSFGRRFQKLGHRVHFALLESTIYNEQSLSDMRDAWDTLDLLPNSRPLWADGFDIPFDHWYEPGLGEDIRRLCWKYDIDVVFCSYVFQSKLLEYVPARLLKVIDTHDKMGNRYDMLRANGQPVEFFSCTPEEEGAYLRRADLVMARRAEEARYFNEVTGLETALVLPHVEDAHFIEKAPGALRKVGIVASANRINLIILHDFLAEIARCCGDDCPFEVFVAGQVRDMVPDLSSEQQAVFARPWLRMLGFVPDISSFYRDVDVIVSPVTMGTGINVKTVQAMAFGMPLLTTRVGIKGIETEEPLHHHESLTELIDSLLALTRAPEELTRLAEISVSRYREFLIGADLAVQQMFHHPKLIDHE